MSLVVIFNRIKLMSSRSLKYAVLEFRGVTKVSIAVTGISETLRINEQFIWEVPDTLEPGETLTITLMSRRWGMNKIIGTYTLGMQLVVSDGHLSLIDGLANEKNKHIPVYFDIDVYYIKPASARDPIPDVGARCRSLPASARISKENSPVASAPNSTVASDGEEETPLGDVEKNISNLEQSMMHECNLGENWDIDFDSSDDSRGRRFRTAGKRLFRRGLSMGSPDRVSTLNERTKGSFASAIRSLIRGRQRLRAKAEEETGLLDYAGLPRESEPMPSTSQASSTSNDVIIDIETPNTTPVKKWRSKAIPESTTLNALKAGDFQVCVTIIEARQLVGLNMDPVVCVNVGEQKKYTSVKESTNCPYYNEYFVFDFHMPPVMLLDKIINLSVLQSRNILRSNKLLGSFKLDVATVWGQPGHQFYRKWALLTDPEDCVSGAKGYLKCDISVIGKGDSVKIPPKNDKDEDDIEANLLLPSGVPIERQRAKYVVSIYKADGLPKASFSVLSNVKRALIGDNRNLGDPFVQVSFAGMKGSTSVRKNSVEPVWNERITFNEMFPLLCQRLKVQLRDNDPVHPNIIGTHFIDMKSISHDGDKGYLPTFGPAYIYLYGSTRDVPLIDQHSSLNTGMGEGVAYRARLLISVHTELVDIIDNQSSDVEVDRMIVLNEPELPKNEEFFIFATLFEANMIDKSIVDKLLSFELSIGNAGNNIDGVTPTLNTSSEIDERDLDLCSVDGGYWHSTTFETKCMSNDRVHFYIPYWEYKQCMAINTVWPDNRRRIHHSNKTNIIIEKFEEGLSDVQAAIDIDSANDSNAVTLLKSVLENTSIACAEYSLALKTVPPFGITKLDKERHKMCITEFEQLSQNTRNLKALVTKHSIKDRLVSAFSYLNTLKQTCEDPQHTMPDVFIWLLCNGKRVAYQRIPVKDIMYSENKDECGKCCGKLQTLFMRWPGKKATSPSGWSIPSKINIYLWLGHIDDKRYCLDGLPPGYQLSNDLKRIAKKRGNLPSSLYYMEKRTFQLRAYIYQARSLIGSDSSGLSDPFARVVIGDMARTTQVIDETLSPTWDELLVFDGLLIYGSIEYIKEEPPVIIVEIFDQDKVGKSEFIGRAIAKPHVKSIEESYKRPNFPPSLEWYEIRRGDDHAGELLAAFELLEGSKEGSNRLPDLPSPKVPSSNSASDLARTLTYSVPEGIRPTLSKYRIEVLFWGLRELKRVHLLTVDRPRVDIECAGNIIYSSVIQNASRNPNFTSPIKFVDVELPDQDLYRPPLTIRVIDCRSFGRFTLVGTHTINSIHKYMYKPKNKKDREAEERNKSLIPLENIDLRTNSVTQEDLFFVVNEKESCPLLKRQQKTGFAYGLNTAPIKKRDIKREMMKKRKESTESVSENDEGSKDWWTKYFASIENMIEEERVSKIEKQGCTAPVASTSDDSRYEVYSTKEGKDKDKRSRAQSPKIKINLGARKKNQVSRTSLAKIYNTELESVLEFEEFKEWLKTFELYRGKKTGNEIEDESRVAGIFKGALKVYKWPIPKGINDCTVMGFDPNNGFFQGVPNNEPIHVLVRVYIVKATDLHPMDLNGKADPYIVLHLGSKRISDKESYVSKQLNPVFGKCFEIEATFPQDSMLTVQVIDWDLLGSDDIIGETKIDLENRFYSRHRATCGLPVKYEEQGYNRWRDSVKPTQILGKLCKDAKLEPPIYEYGRVKINHTIFNMPMDNVELFSNPKVVEEQMALVVLHRWQEMPKVGTKLVPEHIENRPLYNNNKPGVEQGRLEMWVDMFPMDMPLPGPPLDISPRKPKSYEMRLIVWNTDDVVLEDDAFFSGEKMSDIYVKGWLKGHDDCQHTDIHYRSLTGEGNFNWRFIYPFEYLEAEERIVISRKESMFSWDETECKIPARLELQVWDADHFSADDFLGALTLDLNRFPRGAKTSKLCTLDMLKDDGTVPMVNIFKQKRVKGWWPFYIKRENEEMVLTGKLEAEIHLLTHEEAEKMPVGPGRSEPDPLDKPNRPDASFVWFLNPLKSLRYILWHNYKWTILKGTAIFMFGILILLFFYAIPGYTVKKFLGA